MIRRALEAAVFFTAALYFPFSEGAYQDWCRSSSPYKETP